MNKLLFLALLFPFATYAQDSCKLIRQTDPYTKLNTISTGFIALEGGSITIDASKPEVDVFFAIKGGNKCFTNGSTAAVYFVGSKVKQSQRNDGSMNCEGLFHFIYRNTATPHFMLRKMSTQKVEKIVFTGNDKTETILTLTPEQQETLMALTACMVKTAPTLIQ